MSSPENFPWFEYPKFDWEIKHAVIIGGGIAASQVAWHLCQSNWQVTIIEKHNKIATEASGNPIGVILPKITSKPSIGEDFYTQCFNYTSSQLKLLKQQGKDIEWEQSGALQLTHNSRELKRWFALQHRTFHKDFLQTLDETDTSIQAGIPLPYKSCYFPRAGWIKPESFCKALTDNSNCKIIVKSEVSQLIKKGINWQILDINRKVITQAEVVIICAGKDLTNFQQTNFLPTQLVAGQTTVTKATTSSQKLKTVLGHEGYLTPSVNAQHIFGATFDRDVYSPTVSIQSDERNISQLKKYLSEFSNNFTKFESAHAAVRVTSPDRFPYFGAVPNEDFYRNNYHDLHKGKQYKKYPKAKYTEGLFVLGGLGSRGLTTSGLCAKKLTDIIENKSKASKIKQNCHPARFLIKSLKRNQKI